MDIQIISISLWSKLKTMKKILLLLLLTVSVLYGNSQKYTIEVSLIQNFKHPFMLTNDAIRKDSVTYLNCGETGKSTYVFDITNKKLYRDINGLKGTFNIVNIGKNNGIFHVQVDFPDVNVTAYYTLTEVDGVNKMLVCRWITEGNMIGWFDKDVKIKKES